MVTADKQARFRLGQPATLDQTLDSLLHKVVLGATRFPKALVRGSMRQPIRAISGFVQQAGTRMLHKRLQLIVDGTVSTPSGHGGWPMRSFSTLFNGANWGHDPVRDSRRVYAELPIVCSLRQSKLPLAAVCEIPSVGGRLATPWVVLDPFQALHPARATCPASLASASLTRWRSSRQVVS
jgi:hypothetical protein